MAHPSGLSWKKLTRKHQGPLYLLVTVIVVLYLLPVLWMFITSIRPTADIYHFPPTVIPKHVTLANYVYVLTKMEGFKRYFLNSVVVTTVSVGLVLLASSMGGYAFGMYRFKGKELLFMGVIFVLTIPYIMYLIPTFIMEDKAGLLNTWLGLILPYVAINLPWGLLIMRGAFSTIPMEIRDAATIDGCSELQMWYKVLLPIAKPAIAATTIISFVFIWQEFLFASTLMSKNEWQTLPVGIVWMRDELQTMVYGRIGAMIILSIIPVFVPFVLLRDFFVKGLSEGMLKG